MNPEAFEKFVREHECQGFLEYSEDVGSRSGRSNRSSQRCSRGNRNE